MGAYRGFVWTRFSFFRTTLYLNQLPSSIFVLRPKEDTVSIREEFTEWNFKQPRSEVMSVFFILKRTYNFRVTHYLERLSASLFHNNGLFSSFYLIRKGGGNEFEIRRPTQRWPHHWQLGKPTPESRFHCPLTRYPPSVRTEPTTLECRWVPTFATCQ